MNDKKKHLRRCPRIAAHEYIRIFTTTTSDEQYFLNEKAVPYRGKYLLSSLLLEK